MTVIDDVRSLRWFLFFWLTLVLIWGIKGGVQKGWEISIVSISIYTGLIGLLGILLWQGWSGKVQRRYYGLYFTLLGWLAMAASVISRQDSVALSLYCALLFSAIIMLERFRPIAAVALCYVLLLILSTLIITVLTSLNPWLPNLFQSPHPVLQKWSETFISTDQLTIPPDYVALLLFTVGFSLLYTQRLSSHRQLVVAHSQLQTSSEQIEALTRLTERQRLARELHDTLAQGLAGLILQLQVADAYQSKQQYERAHEIIQQAIQRARTALMEARQAIDDLRMENGNFQDCMQAVWEEIQRFTLATGIACDAELSGLEAIEPAHQAHAIRAIAEGLANVMRHADARHVHVRAISGETLVSIEVEDDGKGCEQAQLAPQNGHYGLIGLRERARQASGIFEIRSTPGQGTRLCFSLPKWQENQL